MSFLLKMLMGLFLYLFINKFQQLLAFDWGGFISHPILWMEHWLILIQYLELQE